MISKMATTIDLKKTKMVPNNDLLITPELFASTTSVKPKGKKKVKMYLKVDQ